MTDRKRYNSYFEINDEDCNGKQQASFHINPILEDGQPRDPLHSNGWEPLCMAGDDLDIDALCEALQAVQTITQTPLTYPTAHKLTNAMIDFADAMGMPHTLRKI